MIFSSPHACACPQGVRGTNYSRCCAAAPRDWAALPPHPWITEVSKARQGKKTLVAHIRLRSSNARSTCFPLTQASTGPLLDTHWTSTGPYTELLLRSLLDFPLDLSSTRLLLAFYWASPDLPLDLYWNSTGHQLDPYWTSTAPRVHFNWTTTGPELLLRNLLDCSLYWSPTRLLLDSFWASAGLPLDLYWTSTGPLLDTYWTSTGTLLHFDWTSTGPSVPRLSVH